MPYCPACGQEVSPGAQRCPSCGATRVPDPTVAKGEKKIVWLLAGLGCLVVGIALAGIFAAILIPNFLDALHKAKQKRSMADMQELGTAIEGYRADHDGVLPAGATFDELVTGLEPDYGSGFARTDGWQRPFVYTCWTEGRAEVPSYGRCDSYWLISPGRDGELDVTDPFAYEEGAFDRSDYDRDLVYSDGSFVRYPEG